MKRTKKKKSRLPFKSIRSSPSSAAQDVRLGIAWYAEAEWQRLREVAADPDELKPTYAEWLQGADQAARDLTALGMLVERVDIRVSELETWCRTHNRVLDGQARSEFVTEMLRHRDVRPPS
jgi:hypothetical protein